ncbi:MAG: ABC transporter ATP-binding protein [Spirochaetaceae bacterium]|jgi:putative ABC transport system ATP-binding protein|nr:ABC transporter ATP-binding protein [Spirochaetaceae bacterium]
MENVVVLENVSKVYGIKSKTALPAAEPSRKERHFRSHRRDENAQSVRALRDISFAIKRGEYVSITGPSGSGKTTCMNMIGCLDRPSGGLVLINGQSTVEMDEQALAVLRNRTIGFVFQQYHLLPSMTVLENVTLPLRYLGMEKGRRRERAMEVLERVSLADKARRYPNELSGGQKQRAAIARAVATNPTIVLADEPTGALDSGSGALVLDMFADINQSGTTVILVTHDSAAAAQARRRINIIDGVIDSDIRSGDATGRERGPDGERHD